VSPTRGRPPIAKFDADAEFEADAVLRDAARIGFGMGVGFRYRHARQLPPMPAFSPAVRRAVCVSIREAADLGAEHASLRHLLVALLDLPGGAASELVRQWQTAQEVPLSAAVRADPAYDRSGTPPMSATAALKVDRVLPATKVPRILVPPWRALVWLLHQPLRHNYRRHGARYGHPILLSIEAWAGGKTVHIGRTQVTAVEALLCVIDLHEQLDSAGIALPPEVGRWNEGGKILAIHGIRGSTATRAAATVPYDPRDREEDLSGLPTKGWKPTRRVVGLPAMGRTALAALREASHEARRLGHPFAGTTHLLHALLTEPDGPAARFLRLLGADPDSVRSDVDARLEAVTHDNS
jgi:hypothetical protein